MPWLAAPSAETEAFLLGCFEQSEKIGKLKFTSPTATTPSDVRN